MSIYIPKPFFEISYKENTLQQSTSHFHNVYELCFFLSGSRKYIVNNHYFSLNPGEIILIKPLTYHSTQGSSGVSRYVIAFSKEFLLQYFTPKAVNQFLSCFSNHHFSLNKYYKKTVKLFEELYLNSKNNEEIAVGISLGNLLFEISQMLPKDNDNILIERNKTEELLEKLLNYINENISTIKTIKDLADYLQLSESYLSAIFKQNTGLSIMSYIISIRMNNAIKLLTTSNKSIEDIAYECGFESSNYFCNTFKKHMGTSPTKYRKQELQHISINDNA